MKYIFFLLFLPLQAWAQEGLKNTDSQCLQYALWMEARGEGILTQRAVLDVIHERMRATGKDACRALRVPYQFPYMVDGVQMNKLDKKWKIRYNFISKMDRVLPKGYVYFNDVKYEWGRGTIKIGRLYFSR